MVRCGPPGGGSYSGRFSPVLTRTAGITHCPISLNLIQTDSGDTGTSCFPQHGNLKQTTIHLIRQSPHGLTAQELMELLDHPTPDLSDSFTRVVRSTPGETSWTVYLFRGGRQDLRATKTPVGGSRGRNQRAVVG